jgi:hypothetical protein
LVVVSLNLFLVVVFFERLLVPPPLARNLAELLDVIVAMLLFVRLPLLPEEEDTSDVCTKLECVFFKEEEKEVLATAAEQPFLSMIKLLAVRMNDIISSSFSLSRRVLERKRARFFFTRKCDETDYPIFSAFYCGHKITKKRQKVKKSHKP